jgi:hypothetical protein
MQRLLVLVVFSFGLGATSISCPGTGPGPAVVNAVVDCTFQNQDQIAALIDEFKTLLKGQMPDWSAVYQKAKTAGRAIGGCALVALTQEAITGRFALAQANGSASQLDNTAALQMLQRFRREVANNATFHTAKGDF